MREYIDPTPIVVPTSATLADTVYRHAEEAPDAGLFARREGDSWTDVTCRQFADDVTAVAGGLVAAGLQPGDRVGLLSRTRYEWTLVDYAVWAAGGVVVPIYETSSDEQVTWMLGDSGARVVVVETERHAATVARVRSQLPELGHVHVIDTGGLDALRTAGAATTAADLAARRAAQGRDSLATIIYTSGTTGRPKGCELTHGNFLFDATSARHALPELFSAGNCTLLFLPLAHVFARLVEVACVEGRVKLGHTPDSRDLLDDLGTYHPHFLLAVPRVFEKVYNGSKAKAHAGGKGAIFDRAEATAVAWSTALDTGGPGLRLKLAHALFDRLVYGKLRAALGGRVAYAVSGGAPLGARLTHFFRGVGLTVIEGYGLTETTAPATCNRPSAMRVGSVGRPLPGSGVRIADDGEILLHGPHIFRGYYGNETATSEVLDAEGWFATGDLGALDEDGFLTITGRKKEILVTAGGKNVAPAALEDRIRAHPLVSQCLVVGDQRPFIGALVTLDPEAVAAWASQRGKPTDVAALPDDPDLRAEVQKAVDEANKAVSKAESIRQFRILPVDFTEESGTLTPSLKLKRSVILSEFAEDVEAVYRWRPEPSDATQPVG